MNNACKVCGFECVNGEQHVCGKCYMMVAKHQGFLITSSGACRWCAAPVASLGYGIFSVCRGCFVYLVKAEYNVDTSGPPTPFVAAVQHVPAAGAGLFDISPTTYAAWLGYPSSPPKKRSTCNTCANELSSALDTYHGRNTFKKEMCTPCRDRIYGRFCDDDSVSKGAEIF